MCDIGRFDYHWIEGDERLQRPLLRSDAGALEPIEWSQALATLAERVTAAGNATLRFLISAHASLEELFLIGRIGGALGLPEDGVALSWRTRDKPQPPGAKFTIPPVDAPNVNGARDLGFPVRRPATARRTSSRSGPRSSRAASRRSTSSIRAPTARSATSRGSSRRGRPDGCRC